MEDLRLGLVGEASTVVTPEHTARSIGSGHSAVFSTPNLVGLMEQAARNAVDGKLREGSGTVGTYVEVHHLAATPVGMQVRARAKLIQVQGRKLYFRVEAHDDVEKIGEGLHERFIVDLHRFLEKATGKGFSNNAG